MSARTYIIDRPSRREQVANIIREADSQNPVIVEIRPYIPKRTDAQNRLYWMWIGEICTATGHDPTNKKEKNHVHKAVKSRLLGERTVKDPLTGKVKKVPQSTTRLSVEKFTEFLQVIEQNAEAFLGAGGKFTQPHDYRPAMGLPD